MNFKFFNYRVWWIGTLFGFIAILHKHFGMFLYVEPVMLIIKCFVNRERNFLNALRDDPGYSYNPLHKEHRTKHELFFSSFIVLYALGTITNIE